MVETFTYLDAIVTYKIEIMAKIKTRRAEESRYVYYVHIYIG